MGRSLGAPCGWQCVRDRSVVCMMTCSVTCGVTCSVLRAGMRSSLIGHDTRSPLGKVGGAVGGGALVGGA